MKPVALLSSDIDGTLAGDESATHRFRIAWQSLKRESRPLLVYNSGRLADDILEFAAKIDLPSPDYVIGGVGTMLVDTQGNRSVDRFHARLSEGWSLDTVEAILERHAGTARQPEIYQHAFKSSWYLHDASQDTLADIEGRLRQAGLAFTMIYSSKRDLDILPLHADKGQALTWLCNDLGIGLDQTLVAGDTGNDRSMFDLPGVRGIVVGNALPELLTLGHDSPNVFNATQTHAAGVLEGLVHWSVLNDPSQETLQQARDLRV